VVTQVDNATGVVPTDDQALVQAIAARSSEALSALYDRYAATVFGLARRVTGRQEDAEEVVQDVFAQVWRQASRYQDGRASVAGWLVMLTRTRAIDRVRARTARPDQAAPVSPDAIAPLATDDADPEAVTISMADARLVRGVLADLPAAQRTLIELAYYEGLTHTEIASRTATPLGTVKTRLRTALSALRAVLGPKSGAHS
jgi:RNA polymerase sigma-70 factor (ECF subfamily)